MIYDLRFTMYGPPVRKLYVMLLAVAMGLSGCGKKETPPEAMPNASKAAVSVADETAPPPPSAPVPTGEPVAEAPTAPALTPFEAKIPEELRKIMVLAQKQALATGKFPSSWEEMIAAKLITEPPRHKDGKPITWQEFQRAIDPP